MEYNVGKDPVAHPHPSTMVYYAGYYYLCPQCTYSTRFRTENIKIKVS